MSWFAQYGAGPRLLSGGSAQSVAVPSDERAVKGCQLAIVQVVQTCPGKVWGDVKLVSELKHCRRPLGRVDEVRQFNQGASGGDVDRPFLHFDDPARASKDTVSLLLDHASVREFPDTYGA
jgi:hypothetical protein